MADSTTGGLQALILAGGHGTRFWPLSRRDRPKQLQALDDDLSLLRRTMLRLQPLIPAESVWVVTTRALAPAIRAELPEVPESQVLAEPMGRNTAPAIGWSMHRIRSARGDSPVAVLPADHRIDDSEGFRRTLEAATRHVVTDDRVMTLGVMPRRPETGYGYLELGAVLDSASGLREVRRFTEKPDLEQAREFVASGDYLWNAGIFLFRAGRVLELLARFEPALAEGLDDIARHPDRIDELYAALPKISVDYAVMERCEDLGTLPLDCGWSDLGSWQALAEVLDTDASGNAVRGQVVQIDSNNNMLFSDDGTIAVIGVSDLVIVRTEDAVLVMPKARSQDVKAAVSALLAGGREDLL